MLIIKGYTYITIYNYNNLLADDIEEDNIRDIEDEASAVDDVAVFAIINDDNIDIKDEVVVIDTVVVIDPAVVDVVVVCSSTNT